MTDSAASLVDASRDPREGEQLDAAAVGAWLKQQVPGLTGDCTIRQFPGGSSNLTYHVMVGDRDMVLRRPPFGRIAKSANDMVREARILQRLKPVFHYVPGVVAICEDDSVMGAGFYVMERIKGIIPRKDFPKGMEVSPELARQLCEKLLDVLIELHSIDHVTAGLADLGKPAGYVKRQVEGWSKRYTDAMTPDAPDCTDIMQWLHDKQPGEVKHCIIHNDYRFDNVVLDAQDPKRIIGVLDWEMSTLGDPLMELGTVLCTWTEATDPPVALMSRQQPTTVPGMMTRAEVMAYYCRKMQLSLDKYDFYRVYGLFRMAGIVQQIYYRYFHGQTKDPRFAPMVYFVQHLAEACRAQIRDSNL
ncbi:MAG: phosphotransferase family protein [Pseudomonadota bacterium]